METTARMISFEINDSSYTLEAEEDKEDGKDSQMGCPFSFSSPDMQRAKVKEIVEMINQKLQDQSCTSIEAFQIIVDSYQKVFGEGLNN